MSNYTTVRQQFKDGNLTINKAAQKLVAMPDWRKTVDPYNEWTDAMALLNAKGVVAVAWSSELGGELREQFKQLERQQNDSKT